MGRRELYFSDDIPLAYLITFRCYGTWMHGDKRGSVDRQNNRYRTPFISPSERWRHYNARLLKHAPVELNAAQRAAVEASIRETCTIRNWTSHAVNARTNHVHSVVSAPCLPEPVLTAFKANATRQMRISGLWKLQHSPWLNRGSKRYLWTPTSVDRAINYVMNGQGDQPFNDV